MPRYEGSRGFFKGGMLEELRLEVLVGIRKRDRVLLPGSDSKGTKEDADEKIFKR